MRRMHKRIITNEEDNVRGILLEEEDGNNVEDAPDGASSNEEHKMNLEA
jgi:hypothetical protein